MDDGSFWIGDEHGPWLLHFGADGRLLEAPIPGYLNAGVRLLEYDLELRAWSGREWSYRLDSADHAVSEIVRDPFNGGDGYLIIELDTLQGPATAFKKIFRIHLSRLPEKVLTVDLLNITDPEKNHRWHGQVSFSVFDHRDALTDVGRRTRRGQR